MTEPVLELDKAPEEPRDRTKLLWGLVILIVLLMIGALWLGQRPKPSISQVRAKHILINCNFSDPVERNRALDRITQIRERILKGESFEALAREYSEDTASARRGGDLGWQPRGVYEGNFELYCWTAEVGKLSDIIISKYGFHLIVVTDRIIADAEKYEQELDKETREKFKEGGGAK